MGDVGHDDIDVRAPSRLRSVVGWLRAHAGLPRTYVLTRWLILRLLGIVYVFAFLGLILQGPALLGSHGLTPAATYVELRQAERIAPMNDLWGVYVMSLLRNRPRVGRSPKEESGILRRTGIT